MPDTLINWLVPRAPKLIGLAWRAAWILAAGLLFASFLLPAHRWFLLVYIAPLLPTGAWWLALRSRQLSHSVPAQVWIDGAAFVLGGLRVFGGWGVLPYSGHMLFLTYAIATTSKAAFRAWALALFIMTTAYKLQIRQDWLSWSSGLAVGAACAILWFWASKHSKAVV